MIYDKCLYPEQNIVTLHDGPCKGGRGGHERRGERGGHEGHGGQPD